MKKGIVITTSPTTNSFLTDCLNSLTERKYEVLVVHNNTKGDAKDGVFFREVCNDWNGFELGGILRGAEYFDEFIHLMDTTVIKDPNMFDVMFDSKGSVYLSDGFFSYLGKYKKEILDKVGIPKVDTKMQAVLLERDWNAEYLKHDPYATQFIEPLAIQSDVFEEKHGRKNMVLENNYIKKYKGCWDITMVTQ